MVGIVKAMVSPVVTYGCESGTIKKAECWRVDAFEQWYWRRLLRVPWTARRSNQSILKEINPEYSLEGLMLKLKLQLLWLPDAKSRLIWKNPDAGKDWRQEEKGTAEDEMVGWHYWLNGHEFEQPPGDGEGQRSLACCSSWGHKESDTTEWLNYNNNDDELRRQVKSSQDCYLPTAFIFFLSTRIDPLVRRWLRSWHERGVGIFNTERTDLGFIL